MTSRLFVWVGTIASVGGLVVSFHTSGQPISAVQGSILTVAGLFILTLIGLDIWQYRKSLPRKCKSTSEIKEFMREWISQGSRVVIFTRDMSWADDDPMRYLLFGKARGSELTICLPARTQLANDLEKAGAQVLCYDNLHYIPESRFTIINSGRMDAKVAVGRKIGNRHVIEEFSLGEHPIFSVANDLVEVLRQSCALARKDE